MRKLGRLLLKLLGILAALIIILAVYIYWASNKKLHRTLSYNPQPITLPTSAEALARGRHLAEVRGCTTCHGVDLGGATVIDNPAMGLISGPNLTSGEGSVTKSYQIVDWVRSLQHGVNPAGRPLVLMPSEEFAHFTLEDLGDVIAYVKSVPPVNRASVPIRVGPVARGLMVAGKFTFAADVIDHSAAHVEALTPAVSIEYGRYVATSCVGCHNPNLSGGKIAAGPPDWPPAANLTLDEHSDLKNWSEADFVATIRTHKKPNGQELSTVMPEVFGKLSDTELKAIFVYLRSLPPKATGT
jgi:mono/diheme cytochrome c family protein